MAERRSAMNTGLHTVPVFNKTVGLQDSVDALRAGDDALVVGRNVVVDLSGAISRRDGYTLQAAGCWHSLFSCGKYGFGVVDGMLSLIESDLSIVPLVTLGSSRVCYASAFDGRYSVVFLSNGIVTGKVVNKVYSAWTTGAYVGIASTDAKVFDWLLSPPPGQLLEIYNGRMYIADRNVVWYSELMDFSRFRSTSVFVFDDYVTMLSGVSSTLYVSSSDRVYALKGKQPIEMTPVVVHSAGAILDTAAKVSSTKIGAQSSDEVVVFSVSGEGICIGDANGSVLDMTAMTVNFPSGSVGACFISSKKQYVVTVATDAAPVFGSLSCASAALTCDMSEDT